MELWPATLTARRSLLATFEELDGDPWETPSLCEGWTVREVLAHLILAARPPGPRYAAAVLRARGSFDRANHDLAVAEARQPVDDLVSRYREVLEHRFAPPGWPAAAPYSDIVLHTLDVRVPLGIDTDRPAADYEPVMGILFSRMGFSFTQNRRPAVTWTATDHTWSRGDGPEVRGSMVDLTLAAAGRSARLDRLTGDGAELIAAWLR